MAVFREPLYCPICGERIKEIHQDRGSDFLGDTFLKYEDHVCRSSKIRLMNLAENLGVTSLVKALKDNKNNDVLDDINNFGWIRCSTDNPLETDSYSVTNGKQVWMAYWYNNSRSWHIIGKEEAPFQKESIIAWIFKQEIHELQEYLKANV